jgi:hypothetical protein
MEVYIVNFDSRPSTSKHQVVLGHDFCHGSNASVTISVDSYVCNAIEAASTVSVIRFSWNRDAGNMAIKLSDNDIRD